MGRSVKDRASRKCRVRHYLLWFDFKRACARKLTIFERTSASRPISRCPPLSKTTSFAFGIVAAANSAAGNVLNRSSRAEMTRVGALILSSGGRSRTGLLSILIAGKALGERLDLSDCPHRAFAVGPATRSRRLPAGRR